MVDLLRRQAMGVRRKPLALALALALAKKIKHSKMPRLGNIFPFLATEGSKEN